MCPALLALLACQPAEAPADAPAAGGTPVAADASTPNAAPTIPRTPSTPPRTFCIVAAVSDGDSFRCTDDRRVRLLLLDAPEMSQRPFGTRSRDALRRVLARGDTAWLEYDVQREDRYGRTLAHVWTAELGGTHLNLQQARDGWAVAVVFPPNVRHIEAVRAAVADARRARRGLWADGAFTCEPIAHKRGDC